MAQHIGKLCAMLVSVFLTACFHRPVNQPIPTGGPQVTEDGRMQNFSLSVELKITERSLVDMEIRATLKLKNKSRESQHFLDKQTLLLHNFSFVISDSYGKQVPLKQEVQKRLAEPISGSQLMNVLPPGQEVEYVADLADWFKFSQPGTYSVVAKRPMPTYVQGKHLGIIVIQSNAATFDLR